ncbi:MAG: response regulator [Desulfobacteraceae bacterium]|nr:MAG: response regulator [Desulfobacteraceae bacterium]
MKTVSRFLPISDVQMQEDQSGIKIKRSITSKSWKLLIVDDDDDVHALTGMALHDFSFDGKGVICISARSAVEARRLIAEHPDTALILLDVVMETDDAGLKLVRFIREKMMNRIVQIVLRTGQPGLVPQREAIDRYDINGYSSKVELTAEKMFSIVTASLRSYQMAYALDHLNRQLQNELNERKRAEEEVRRLTRFQEILIDNADIWLAVKDLNGNTIIWNKAAERISGYHRDEVIGNNKIMKWLYPDPSDVKPVPNGLPLNRHDRDSLYSRENAIRCKDGSSRVIAWNLHELQDDSGMTIGIVSLGRDVTEQRLLEEQLGQAGKMQAVGRMATGFAQDFTSLLSVIRGYCDIAISTLIPTERIYGHIRQIDKAAERAEILTKKILSFGKNQPLTLQPVTLNLSVRENQKMLERLAGDHVKLVLQCSQPMKDIEANPVKIEQLLMNLAMNAVEAMPEGGVLTISTRELTIQESGQVRGIGMKPGDYIELTVLDTGIGMSQEIKEQMFEPFFSTKGQGKESGGRGLGLSTVYGIVTQCRGAVSVETEPGKGTAVIIYFPCVDKSSVRTSSFLIPENLSGTETVLIVEDHPGALESTSETLRIYGYNVLQASTLKQAVKVCRESRIQIDLLLVDVMMPSMSGLQLSGRILEICPEIKVLYMSGYSRQIIGKQGMPETGYDFIQKPFTAIRLLRMVRQVLEKPASDAEL